ncbi:MAG: hypothetical protein ACOCVP_01800 [Wenzhouxiangella sp.]
MIDPGLQRLLSAAFGIALAGVVLYAGLQLIDPATPALIAAGLGLCALAPLMFLLRAGQTSPRQHPVLVSSLCGLGCVMIMIGIQRHGDQHQPILVIALLVLIAWMGYQRKIWRAPGPQDHPDGPE